MTLGCISKRGNDEALQHLNHELKERKDEQAFMTFLLRDIPARGDVIHMDSLIAFLKDPDFEPKDELRRVLLKMPTASILSEVFTILKSEAGRYPRIVKSEALKLLESYNWPGNVRQLRNVMRTATAMCEGSRISVEDLPEDIRDVIFDDELGDETSSFSQELRI